MSREKSLQYIGMSPIQVAAMHDSVAQMRNKIRLLFSVSSEMIRFFVYCISLRFNGVRKIHVWTGIVLLWLACMSHDRSEIIFIWSTVRANQNYH